MYYDPMIITRVNNCARNNGYSPQQFADKFTDQELLRFPNFGRKCLRYLRDIYGQNDRIERMKVSLADFSTSDLLNEIHRRVDLEKYK